MVMAGLRGSQEGIVKLPNGLIECWMHEVGSDFGKRLKNEASLVQEWMGDHQLGIGPYFVREDEDIEVD